MKHGIIAYLFIAISIFSCRQQERVKDTDKRYLLCCDLHAQGQFATSTYTFCGVVPTEVQYLYKHGRWKYWNQDDLLIAEGTYKPVIDTVQDEGGCIYRVIVGKINEDDWRFRDKNGNLIKPENELIHMLESCSCK
ncbi:MAG TPA: hypothetical protein PLL53_20365 [Saprospiraceae bacterium]|nr:hypothetical protein [Saprospiraceae bacterium]